MKHARVMLRTTLAGVLLCAALARGESGAPATPRLAAGDLGVARLKKVSAGKATLELTVPRAWRDSDVKAGTKLVFKGPWTVADDQGVLLSGDGLEFSVRADCENDGGGWNAPYTRVELDLEKLGRPLARPYGSGKFIGVLLLGAPKREALRSKPDKRTVMRVDLDADGQPDAELQARKHDSGCGWGLEEYDLHVRGQRDAASVMCCGP